MKTKAPVLLRFLMVGLLCLGVERVGLGQVTLGASPYIQNFDGIGSGAPTGWTVRTGASASALGSTVTFPTATNPWNSTTGAFYNYASANVGSSSDNTSTQAGRTDRALGIRPSGSFGDPGQAFVLQLSNTSGLYGFQLSLNAQLLSPQTRTTTYQVDFGIGSSPTSFAQVGSSWTDLGINGGLWGKTTLSFNFLGAIDNISQNIWIRISSINGSTGTSSRSTFAIDDFVLTYCNSLTNYYSKSTGNLNLTSTWGTNTDGSGTAPTNFANSCQVFNIRNGNSGNLSAPWVVSGTGSKIVVEQTDFTIPSANAVTATIDVNANRTLNIQNSSVPTLGTLDNLSTVIFSSSSSQTIPAGTFGTISITGAGTKLFAGGNFNVNGDLIADNTTLDFQGSTPFSQIFFAGNFLYRNTVNHIDTTRTPNLTTTGNGNQLISSSSTSKIRFFNLVSSKSAGSLTFGSNSNFLYRSTSGSVAFTFNFSGTSVLNFASGCSIQNLNSGGDLNLNFSNSAVCSFGGNNIFNLTPNSSFKSNFLNSSIFYDGGSNINVGNNLSLDGSSNANYSLTGTFTLNASSGTANVQNNNSSNNVIVANLNNLIVNSQSTAAVSFRPTAGNNNILIRGNLSVSGLGTGNLSLNANTISIGGSFFYDRTADNINAASSNIVFYGSNAQFRTSVSGGNIFNNISIPGGASLTMFGNINIGTGGVFSIAGTLNAQTSIVSSTGGFNLGGTLITSNTNGVTGTNASTGSIQVTGSETYNASANYIFNGSSAQITGFNGTGNQIKAANNIVVSTTSAVVTLDNDIQTPGITGVLSVPSGAVFSMPNSFNINKSGSGVVSIAGTLQTGDANGFSDASSANFQGFSGTSDILLGTNSIIHYNGGTQAITNQIPYQNLLISITGSTNKTPAGTISVVNNLSISGSGGGVLVGSSNIFSVGGSWFNTNQSNFSEGTSVVNWFGSGSQNINASGGENFYILSVSGTGTLTTNNAVSVGTSGNGGLGISSGTFDVGTNTLNGNANITMTGGLLRLAKTGVTLPEIDNSTNYTISGGTIELYGSGNQTLRGLRKYNILSITGNSYTSVTNALTGINSMSGVSINNSATLDCNGFQVGDIYSGLTMTGTSKLLTSGSGTRPDFGAPYILGSATSIEFGGTSATSIRKTHTTGNNNNVDYQNVTISGASTKTLPSYIGIKGNLSIGSPAILDATNAVVSILGNWTNYNASGFTETGSTVILGGASQILNVSATTGETFNNLYLTGSGTKTISPASTAAAAVRLLANGTLSINGVVFNLNNDSLVLQAPSLTGTRANPARLAAITGGGSFSNASLFTQQRDVQTAARLYRFVSSPVQNLTASQWQKSTHITGQGGASNGFDATNTNNASMFYYSESIAGANYLGFTSISNTSNTITPGVGYRILIRGDRGVNLYATAATQVPNRITLYSTGTPNTGTQTLPVTYTSTGDANADGWNLVGNPYPCEIDWNASSGWTKSNLDGSIYIYDPASGGGYYSNNGVTSSDGRANGNIIASHQGFFVKATSTPTLTATESVKVASASSNANHNFRSESLKNLMRLKLTTTADTNNFDFTTIHFREDASRNFDNQADAYQMNSKIVTLSSIVTPNLLSINSLPTDTGSFAIPISVKSLTTGGHNIKVYTFENFEAGYKLKLIDKYLRDSVELGTNVNYAFQITSDTASKGNRRFVINGRISAPIITLPGVVTVPSPINNSVPGIVTNSVPGVVSTTSTIVPPDMAIITDKNTISSISGISSTTGINPSSKKSNTLIFLPNPSNGSSVFAKIIYSQNCEAIVTISDISGNLIATFKITLQTGENLFEIENSKLIPQGVYIVKIESSEGVLIEKLCITK
ncbi:MAG: T9SS type A sorting domain-containing protein [Bacteroidota bacterium]|nr:T9SS type A sorting domain-containing protein [Bacteroidota bacterium]